MRRLKKIKVDQNSEFELDLAPLLAVMVKLVPVLLVSSAFVQMMVIESQLPQVVSEAIERQEQQPNATNIALDINATDGIQIVITENGQHKTESIPLKNGTFNLTDLHQKLIAVKKSHPEVFKIEINPEGKIQYNDIVKIMDEARQAHDSSIKFPVEDKKQGKTTETNYMFPEVVFANMMEG